MYKLQSCLFYQEVKGINIFSSLWWKNSGNHLMSFNRGINKLRYIHTMIQSALIKKFILDPSLLAWRYVHNAF